MGVRLAQRSRVYYREKIITEDEYGATLTKYGTPQPMDLSFQPVAGEVDLLEFGEKAGYILRTTIDKEVPIKVFDGFNIDNTFLEEPDYLIFRIKPWYRQLEVFVIATEEAN